MAHAGDLGDQGEDTHLVNMASATLFSPVLAQKREKPHCVGLLRVGDTGIEPVTSRV